ncbi:hypothetical protein OM427_16930 [Halomonas sp. 18H]|nr:hypothetical protein [Halomonas sp. 18H]MCW4151214.1 hypothetical protein [Halomonas sp. 18H]
MDQPSQAPDFIAQLKHFAALVRRDRRLQGRHVHTTTLTSEAESRDSVTLDAVIEHGRVQQLGYRVRACTLAQATTGLMATRAEGLDLMTLTALEQQIALILQDTPPPAESLIWPELLTLQNAAAMPSRHDVALLPFHALRHLMSAPEDAPSDSP